MRHYGQMHNIPVKPPPLPCPFLRWRMKKGFALSLTHRALASNTSSGVIHILVISSVWLRTKKLFIAFLAKGLLVKLGLTDLMSVAQSWSPWAVSLILLLCYCIYPSYQRADPPPRTVRPDVGWCFYYIWSHGRLNIHHTTHHRLAWADRARYVVFSNKLSMACLNNIA